MVRNVLPKPQTLGRIARHANKADELADIFLDPMPPIPDADLFYQPGLDEATNPFAHKHSVEPRGESKQKAAERQTLEEQFKQGSNTDKRTKLKWSSAGQTPSHDPGGPSPNPSDPFADTPDLEPGDVPPPDIPDVIPGPKPEPPSYEPDQFWAPSPWPEVRCGEKDPITGKFTPCGNAAFQIQTAKNKFQKSQNNRKGRYRYHSRKKSTTRWRNYSRRDLGGLG